MGGRLPRRLDRQLDEPARGAMLVRVTALSPLRVDAGGTDVEPVASHSLTALTLHVGDQLIGLWSDTDPDLLIVIDRVG